MKHYPSQKGFTLVELSIVLVIIGLIVSSVLVGQDLVKSAELRATIAQYREFSTAVTTFRGKYPGIPGDLDNGGKFGLGVSGTITPTFQDGSAGDGDGNGVIESGGGADILDVDGEMATFWAHLTTPGLELIPGLYNGDGGTVAGIDVPALKFGSNAGWGVFGTGRNANFLLAGLADDADSVTNTVAVFVPIDAFNVDEKIDDGVPTSGDVQSRGASATDIDAAATTALVTDATVCNLEPAAGQDEYQFTASIPLCTLRFALTTP